MKRIILLFFSTLTNASAAFASGTGWLFVTVYASVQAGRHFLNGSFE